MKIYSVLFIIVFSLALVSNVVAQSLVSNGSFEDGTCTGASSCFLGVGSTAIDYWEIVAGTIDYITGYWQHSDGSRSLDMNGASSGSIRQSFSTVGGRQYKVTFDMAGNPGGDPQIKTLQATAGPTTAVFTFDLNGRTLQDKNNNMGWEEKSFLFTATGSTTTITFTSLSSSAFGPTLDNIRVLELFQVIDIDIKPQSCPNPLNTKSKGILPVAILGTASFDVTTVDPSTVLLEGVAPIRSNIEDITTPVADSVQCDCTTDGPDGFDDLTLKFDTQEIVDALGSVNDGDELVLTITGNLLDGTTIEGSDCVIIKAKGKLGKDLTGNLSNVPEEYALFDNFPNPFNPTTTIHYELPVKGFVTLKVFDVLGKEVKTLIEGYRTEGRYEVEFDAGNLASGIYIYQFRANNYIATKKMLLMK